MAARAAKRELHPVEELERLRSALGASPQLPRAVLIKGEERYFRDRAIEMLCAAGATRDLELCRYDARDPDFDVGTLCNDLTAAPMFAPGRLVVVRQVGALFNREKREDGEEQDASRPAAVARAILGFLANVRLPAMLVIDAESLRADHAVSKAMAAQGNAVFVFRRLYDSPPPWGDPDPRRTELALWLIAHARERGVALVPDQAAYVVAAIGNDLSALDAELERLKRRGTERVEDAVVWTSGTSPFELSEHLIRGNLAASLAGVEGLFRFGMRDRDGSREVEPAALLAMLFGSMRNKLRQTIARSENEPVGGMAPRAREDLEERARLRPSATWRRLLEDLVTLERRGRSGATVDASDLALLALRWRVASAKRAVRAR
jgi:DNA polymerase III delta subunit